MKAALAPNSQRERLLRFFGRPFARQARWTHAANNRFWSARVPLPRQDSSESNRNGALLESVRDAGVELQNMKFGMIITDKRCLPIHNGLIQTQHEIDLCQQSDALVCGFYPRADGITTTANSEYEYTRQVIPDRVEAIDAALREFGLTSDEILSKSMSSNAPAKILRSFISPRSRSVVLPVPLAIAAGRTAAQIDFAMKQVRADEASHYLRNIDRAKSAQRQMNPVVLVVDNVRSAFNVGSLFRTSETGGVAELVTTGITAHPPNPKLNKTALASVEHVPTRHFDDTMDAIATLRAEGYTIVAMETTSRSQLYTQIDFPEKTALVVGNEITGVDTRVLESADMIAEIPTYGVKNSLNVASALPIVLFEVLRQWDLKKKMNNT